MQSESLLEVIESKRKVINSRLCKEEKEAYSQYFTRSDIAKFMASMFTNCSTDKICLLDPGAGIGILTTAFVDRMLLKNSNADIEVHAFEIDPSLIII